MLLNCLEYLETSHLYRCISYWEICACENWYEITAEVGLNSPFSYILRLDPVAMTDVLTPSITAPLPSFLVPDYRRPATIVLNWEFRRIQLKQKAHCIHIH